MNKPHFTIVLSTGREGRNSEHVAAFIEKHLSQRDDLTAELHDVRTYAQPVTFEEWNEHEETKAWKETVAKTDAFIFVVPEYNWSFPGELKTVLDQDYPGYLGKPAVVAGVGSGHFGGARMMISLNTVLFKIGLINIPFPLYFGSAGDLAELSYEQLAQEHGRRVDKSISKLLVYTEHLKGISEKLT